MKDIIKLEQLQRRATKRILQDYSSDYKSRLTNLNLLPLMYVFEISDKMFFINSIKNPTSSFNINSYISFSNSGTRSTGLKLKHNISHTNKQRHFYFNRICRLWNSLPIINLNLSAHTLLKISILLILTNYIIYVCVALVLTIFLQTLIISSPITTVIDGHLIKSLTVNSYIYSFKCNL